LVVLETNTVLNGWWILPKTKGQVTGGFVLSINYNLTSVMKNLFKTHNPFRLILIIAIMFTSSSSSGQQIKPSNSGYAPVNGIKVYYEVYGEGRPIILLHGAFYTIEMNWAQLIPELSKTRKVIAIEMQGHGHTPFSDRELSITTLASDVEKLMDYLEIDSADVAGFSMGGSVAYQFAVQSPKRLRKLVIISSTYKTSGWLPIVNGGFKDFKPEFFDDTPIKSGYDAVAPDKTKWRKYVEQMIAFAGVPFNVGDSNISKIAAPVLIISGDNDGTNKIELIKTYQLLGGGVSADLQPMPKSQLAIVPSQGHVSLMMETTTLLAYMNSFLN
jgi:pimeloyl-ACP methyl ester carboxylesterase